MQEFTEHLKSSDFWVFSVVFAIVLSVLGNYATRFVDRASRLGTSGARALSTRRREKRIARMNHINEWIDSHENGAILVLSEAHFLCFLGMTLAILVVSTLLLGRVAIAASSSLLNGLLAVGCLVAVVIALAAMNLGGTLLEAVRKHPKGLAGLNQNK
jgi:hypothetical protein